MICCPEMKISRWLSAQAGDLTWIAAAGTLIGSPNRFPSVPSFWTSRVEISGEDQRRYASDRPSGERAGEASPITPSGGEVRVRTLPSAGRSKNRVDLPDSSEAEAKIICSPSGVQ